MQPAPLVRVRARTALLPLVVSVAALAVACGDPTPSDAPSASASTASGAATVAATSTSTTLTTGSTSTTVATAAAAPSATEPEQVPLGQFGYSITHPADWAAETRGTITIAAETEAELRNQLLAASGPAAAISISFDHRDAAFLTGLGLDPTDPSADDLVALNSNVFGWRDLHDQEEVELFGTTAIKVEGTSALGVFIAYQGVQPDTEELFFLGLLSPTAEALDAFRPVWDTMLAGITATS